MEFINISSPSEINQSRRQIRATAMRNYHARRRAAGHAAPDTSEAATPVPIIPRSSLDSWKFNPFMRLPVELSPAHKELVHNICTSKQHNVILFRDTQLACSMLCGASFYAALANIGALTEGSLFEVQMNHTCKLESHNMAKALELIQKMLNDDTQTTTEGLITAVASLLGYARLRNDRKSCDIHRTALEKIVRLRGGLHTLSYDVQVFVFWADVNCATAWDIRPYFVLPVDWQASYTENMPPGAATITKKLRRKFPQLKSLITSFAEVSIFALKVDTDGYPKTSNFTYQNPLFKCYMRRCYLLLCTQQDLNFDDDSSVLNEMLRLSLLIYVTSLARVLAPKTCRSPEQMRKLKRILGKEKIDWGDLYPLRTWIVCIGFLEAEGESDIKWWRKMWKQSLDAFPSTGPHSILPSRLLSDLPREESWEEHHEDGNGEGSRTRRFLDPLSTVILKVVSSIIWVNVVQGKKYRELVGRDIVL